jgi:hypothetical protein
MRLSTTALLVSLLAACGGGGGSGSDSGSTTPGTATGVACGQSTNVFNSSSKVNANSVSSWTCNGSTRTLSGNGIPDHPVTTGNFATPISAQSLTVNMPLAPSAATATTELMKTASGYVLNSVKLDPGTDGSCAGTATSTANGGGCVAAGGRDPWVLEAIGGAFAFGTDESNAHVQPNGQYHYHGVPEGYVTKAAKGVAMTLVGFAIDGFPIYARYGYNTASNASSGIKTVKPSWQKKATPDAGRPSTTVFPMGTFTSDYQYVAGSGDLDECNGRTGVTPEYPAGTYHYYITDTFPFIQRCIKGNR